MSLSPAGQMINDVWLQIPNHYAGVLLDSFVAMPNHVHGIVVLEDRSLPDARQPQGVAATGLSLPDVVHRYKTLTTRLYVDGVKRRAWQPLRGRLWQRSFYDHVIRNELELNQVREYIGFNPGQWSLDTENPDAPRPAGSRTPHP